MKKMMPITMMPGANAFIANVRSAPNAVAPITPPPAATSTSRNVPHTSLKIRRYSNRALSNSMSSRRAAAVRRVNHASTGSPAPPPGVSAIPVKLLLLHPW